HSYLGNYHIWETLTLWDRPEVYGVACKRIDCKERKSAFNSKVHIRDAMRRLLQNVRARYILVSFSNEGYLHKADMLALLSEHGEVETEEIAYSRYVGARIGIHNPRGEKVGKVGHLENVEYVFKVTLPPERWPS